LTTSWLPRFELAEETPQRYPYGARSEAAVYVGELLLEAVPALRNGELHIVAIARRPGVLSKVAIRSRSSLSARIGADHIARVRDLLEGERIDVVSWQRSAPAYIADALGLGEVPPMLLLPGIGHARVLLGEIDVRGIAGWRALNAVLASALTGWRIRLEPVVGSVAWQRLHAAMVAQRSVVGTVVGPVIRGLRIDVLGLSALLSGAQPVGSALLPGQDLEVRIIRMDPDEGRIFVSDRLAPTGQLALSLTWPVEAGARNSSTSRG
jgi:transcription antitermination factor NusA-like protein